MIHDRLVPNQCACLMQQNKYHSSSEKIFNYENNQISHGRPQGQPAVIVRAVTHVDVPTASQGMLGMPSILADISFQ
jgi:hypothetical protein